MKLSIENAGAPKGCLIMENENDNKLYIEASRGINETIITLQSIPVETSDDLPLSIVNYVHKTKENIVLHDTRSDERFMTDPYVIKNKSQSILCISIRYKGTVAGILYLENNLITNAFTPERLEILQIFSSQAAISIENSRLLVHRENAAKLNAEMEIAANIQTGLLPRSPSIDGYEISAYMAPADDVGGDYYDVINVEGRDWIIIGDVSGHGVPAGLVMIMVQTAIHAVLNLHPEYPPSELLTAVNKTITENIKLMDEDKYMTITVFATHENGKFSFAGLHQDIMVYRKKIGNVELIESDGTWIGLIDDVRDMMTDSSLKLDTGDTMLVYTDGITEAWVKGSVRDNRSVETEMFGDERLKEIFSNSGGGSPDEIRDSILKALEGYDCGDDVTMVVVRRV